VETQPERLEERLEIRILTLSDHAALPPDGKLYLHGAGVDQMFVQTLPGALGPLFLVLRLQVPWHMLSEQHIVKIRALDPDRKPIGPSDPLFEAPFELGKPAGMRLGDNAAANMVFGLTGVPIQESTRIYFHVLVDDQHVGSVSLNVQQLPPPTVALLH
jgi:hypothetical protein